MQEQHHKFEDGGGGGGNAFKGQYSKNIKV